jgi:ATPase family associated with various cellular activities (AAA)
VAFLFSGETGTGKTSVALSLANELGVSEDWGLHRVSSGAMDAEAVEGILTTIRYTAPGNGWKLVICDEADTMSPKAKQLWLSALEELPAKTVIVFTTNHAAKFEQRFLDRCEHLGFASDASFLAQDAQALIDKIWAAEGLGSMPPRASALTGLIEKGAISFRRVVQALVQANRHTKSEVKPEPAGPIPLNRLTLADFIEEAKFHARGKDVIVQFRGESFLVESPGTIQEAAAKSCAPLLAMVETTTARDREPVLVIAATPASPGEPLPPKPEPTVYTLPKAADVETTVDLVGCSPITFKTVECKPPKGYALVVGVKHGDDSHELYVNPAGWRFEYLLRQQGVTKRAVTHSVKVGEQWKAALLSLVQEVETELRKEVASA